MEEEEGKGIGIGMYKINFLKKNFQMFHLQETRECCKTPVLNRGHFDHTWGALRIALAVV